MLVVPAKTIQPTLYGYSPFLGCHPQPSSGFPHFNYPPSHFQRTRPQLAKLQKVLGHEQPRTTPMPGSLTKLNVRTAEQGLLCRTPLHISWQIQSPTAAF